MLKGALVSKQGAETLPPGQPQLDACGKEIGFLTSLLRAGAIDNLPKNDDNFCEIIKKVTMLQSEAYDATEMHPVLSRTSTDARMVKDMWRVFDKKSADFERANSRALAAEIDEREFFGQKLLWPSSSSLRQCLDLLSVWVANVACTKPRLNRLQSAMRSLEKNLIDEAKRLEANSRPGETQNAADLDPFAAAFGTMTAHRPPACYEEGIHLREGAIFVSFVAIRAMKARNAESIVKIQRFEDAAKQVRTIGYRLLH